MWCISVRHFGASKQHSLLPKLVQIKYELFKCGVGGGGVEGCMHESPLGLDKIMLAYNFGNNR